MIKRGNTKYYPMEQYREDMINQFYPLRHEFIISYIRRKQKEFNNISYPIRSDDDKLRCIVCGGKFMRRQKGMHNTGKKHQKMLNELIEILSGNID